MAEKIYRCPNPECGQEEGFKIYGVCNPVLYVTATGRVNDSDHGNSDWGNDSTMVCSECDWEAEVRSFRAENQVPKKKILVEPPSSDIVVLPSEEPPLFP